MSIDDSTATDDAATSGGAHRSSPNTYLLAGLALLLVIGLVGFFALRGDGTEPQSADCTAEKVTLTTAPVMESLVAEAVKDVNADEPCIDIQVTTGSVKDVVALLGDPDAELPEIWIPDSPTWKGQLTAAGWTGTPIAEVLAQTPVGLVGGPAAKAPATWSDLLGSGSLSMEDPSAEGASALALLAPYAEIKKTGETPESIQSKVVPVAQTYGERAVAGTANETDLATITASTTQLVPATEQAYLAARRSNDSLTLVAPRSGVPMLQFPLIDVSRGTEDAEKADNDLSARVGRAMTRWFTSSAGVEAIAAAELRSPEGTALPNGIGIGEAPILNRVSQKSTDDILRQWRVLSVPSSVLAVFDLSGSMKSAFGDTTRIQLAATSSVVALDALPDHARVGTWGFSKNRGGEGQSWQEMSPLARLDADAGDGLTQREFLTKDAVAIPGRVRGATGIMDTALAAYKEAQEKWDPAYFNAVVIYTDGASDDSSDLSLTSLVSQLKSLNDPARPVKVLIIGISPDADSPELAQIAAATGGQDFLVNKPDEILVVLGQALLNR